MTTLLNVETPAAEAAGVRPEPAITITAFGLPAPQGSKRHIGRGVMVESSKKVKPWRQDVKHAALDITEAHGDWTVLDGPLAVSMVFTFDRPKGHYRTGRNAHLLRDAAPPRPAGMPDLSKLVRSTEDALTGVVWKDDARVVEYVRLGKWYAGTTAADVLTVPGCVIRVWPLDEAVNAR
ncbi:RusA family crossover junction endodeoxyribonuclease [Streptomyces sp. NPDC058534]|uniref:RusA family crossover junction endodeoxyribonuclease n=1 Tax=Streptomyces sp. NPDC058534 TaxID=3346541 RepID=UPI00364E17F8